MKRDGWGRGLGWLSLALAAAPLRSPGAVGEAIGVGAGQRQQATLRAIGARELAVGVPLVLRPAPALLWARVAGDALDLTLLGRALRRQRGASSRTVATTAVVGGIAALDLWAAVTRSGRRADVELTASTTVTVSADEAHRAWGDFAALPTFMAHLDRVEVAGRRSHWVATAPFGRTVEWDAETTADEPGRRIAWRSLPDSDVETSGEVLFTPAPNGRDTEVRVAMRYGVPGGVLGRAVARWAGEEPHQQLDDDLRRFKQVVETGEVVRSDGAPTGKQARAEFPQHPARPLSRRERRHEGVSA